MTIKPGLVVFDRGGKVNHGSDTIVIVAHKGSCGNNPYWICHIFHPFRNDFVRSLGNEEFTDDEISAMEPIGSIADFIKNIATTAGEEAAK